MSPGEAKTMIVAAETDDDDDLAATDTGTGRAPRLVLTGD
jgi:hypothetical protein